MVFVYLGGGLAALVLFSGVLAVALCGIAARADRDSEEAARVYRAQAAARAKRADALASRLRSSRRRGDNDGETCAATVARS